MKKLNIIVLMSIVLTSCFESNGIYFDIKEQAVLSCGRKGIECLYIKNGSTAEVYTLFWVDSLKKAPGSIILNHVDKRYKITKGWNNNLISSGSFKLKPLSNYSIERVQPDVNAYKISVMTGKDGDIIKAVPDKCN